MFVFHLMMRQPLWDKAPEGDGGGADDPPAGGENAGDPPKMGFKPEDKSGGNVDGKPPEGDGTPPGDSRPDWLSDKYKSIEDQAKAYPELHKKFTQKTDDLKSEVMDEVKKNYGAEIGVPEDIDGYEYPDTVKAPEGELDEGFRTWAKEHNVSPDGFKELAEIYAKSIADPEVERGKLGTDAEARAKIDAANRFANATFEKEDHPSIERLMQTADGVEFLGRLAHKMTGSGVFPNEGGNPPSAKTRDEIRKMQEDPRYGQEAAYTKTVNDAWDAYVAQPKDKRR